MDQFSPPHVDDDSPISVSLPLKAATYIRRFQNAARSFRNPTGKLERQLINGNGEYVEIPAGLIDQCGEWTIQSFKAGLIPILQSELCDLIRWHIQENPDELPGRCYHARCPYNLFSGLCGGNLIKGILDKDSNDNWVLKDQRVAGGLMPRYVDGHLKLSRVERYAATCEWLADLLATPPEVAGTKPKPTKSAEDGTVTPPKKRGRPPLDMNNDIVKEENQLYLDWYHADEKTRITQTEWLKSKGIEVEEGLSLLDRARKRVEPQVS